MTDDEIEARFASIDDAIDGLFGLFGQDSPRLLAQRPKYLRDSGVDAVEVVAGHMMVKPSP